MGTAAKQPLSARDVTEYLDNQPMILTARQTSPAMNFSEDTIAEWMKDGTIECVQFGSRRYVQQSWLRSFLGLPPVGTEQ